MTVRNHPFTDCRWIGATPACSSPIIQRRFSAEKPLKAVLHITGLGYFSASLNGKAVTADRLQPVCSEYGPRDLGKFLYPLQDQLTYRIYYCTYDVSQLLVEGDNHLSVQLGNGWYRQTERVIEGPMTFGDTLKAIYCLELTYADRTVRICSDGSEVWQESEIVYNNLFVGEIHDLCKVPSQPLPVNILPDDNAQLSAQIGAPDRVMRTLQPTLLSERDGVKIYDAGENISGVVRLTVNGKAGEKVVLRFAENLTAEGELDFRSTGDGYTCASGRKQIQTDECICAGEPAVFEPRFCWHAFRYFEIVGAGRDPEVVVIHSDTPLTATFESDSEALCFLFDAFVRTQLNNMHGSIPSDCPHRERLGYTGDGQIAAAAAMMLLDCKDFYRKWMQDIVDCQDVRTGHTQHTSPLGGGGGGPVGWGGAIAVIPYRYFKQFGDTDLARNHWDAVLKWVGYIQTRMDASLIVREEKDGWCLGDWANLGGTDIDATFVNTCLFVRYLDMLCELAPLIDKQADVPALKALQEKCRAAITAAYFDDATGHFCGGIQGADAFGLYAGLGDARTVELLIAHYKAHGAFDTGFIGTEVLLEVLFQHNAADVAYALLSYEGLGSFLYMKRQGATTIWEDWDGCNSHDHPMYGGGVRHLFEGILGIRQAYGTGGYTAVSIQPQMPQNLQYISGTLQTPQGEISVSLRRDENGKVTQETNIH